MNHALKIGEHVEFERNGQRISGRIVGLEDATRVREAPPAARIVYHIRPESFDGVWLSVPDVYLGLSQSSR